MKTRLRVALKLLDDGCKSSSKTIRQGQSAKAVQG